MNPEIDDRIALERAVGRALAGLPQPRAPRTLLPRVLASAARMTPRPWYSRAWLTWPRAWQAASIAALAVMAAGLVWIAPHADGAIDGVLAMAAPAAAGLASVLRGAEVTAAIARSLWSALLGPIVLAVFVVAAVVTLGGGICWNTINRLAAD